MQVRSREGGTGPYDVEVVPVPADDVVDVAVGRPMVGELTVPGEHDVYRFPANAGDIVYLDGAGPCGVNVDYVLSSPSGLDLTGAPYACNDMGRVDLPQSGEYTVTVRSWLGGTGPYDVAALAVPPDTEAFVAVGDRLQGEVTAPGEQHVFLFDAAAGDVVVLEGSGAVRRLGRLRPALARRGRADRRAVRVRRHRGRRAPPDRPVRRRWSPATTAAPARTTSACRR